MCEKCGQVMVLAPGDFTDYGHLSSSHSGLDVCQHCGVKQGLISEATFTNFNAHVEAYEGLREKLSSIPSWGGFVFGLILWPVCFMAVALMHHAGGYEVPVLYKLNSWALLSYPVVHLAAIMGGRMALTSGMSLKTIKKWASLMWLNIVLFVCVHVWSYLFCGGDFRC